MRPPFRCRWCEEMVKIGDLMHTLLPGYHYACALRTMLGSIAHLRGTCSCYSEGSTDGDPPDLTKRQAARLVADFVRHRQARKSTDDPSTKAQS